HPSHILAVVKNVHMLPDLALLVQYPVAERRVPPPDRVQHLTDSRKALLEPSLGLAAGERLQMPRDEYGQRHPSKRLNTVYLRQRALDHLPRIAVVPRS